MIDFNNVSKTYPNGTHALHDVSIHIDKGEFAFIVGASGAGKSTFLKLIMHEESPSSGEIIVNNLNITKMRRRKVPYLRRHMGIVFQDFRLIDKMNVFDNVAFAMRAIGSSASSIKKRVPYILELVGLKNKMKNKPSELSGGEQQRVSLARALVNNPKIILADEPTGALDSRSGIQVMSLFQQLNEEGVTIIMITHDANIANHAKKVLHIFDGEIVEDKERKEKQQAEVQSEKEAKDDTVFSEIEQDFGVKEWEGEI